MADILEEAISSLHENDVKANAINDAQLDSLNVTDSAVSHFQALLSKEQPGSGIRLFVVQPGTPHVDVGICFCPPDGQNDTDLVKSYPGFSLYIEEESIPFLVEATIDYISKEFNSQLVVEAPRLKVKAPQNDAPLSEQVEWVLLNEVNPNLSSHGGLVELVEITDENEVILRFGGGCHGCGMVGVTLKEGIEKSLKEKLPQIKAVKDITDHSKGVNPYYE